MCCLGLTYSDGKKPNTHFGNVFLYSIRDESMRYASLGELISGIREGVMAFFGAGIVVCAWFLQYSCWTHVFVFTGLQLVFFKMGAGEDKCTQ